MSFLKIVLVVIAITFGFELKASTITFAVDDYCPYYCKDKVSSSGQFLAKPGYIIEILNYAFSKENVKIKYAFMPWERGLTEIFKNTVNGIILSTKSDAPDLVFPEQEQGISVGCFIKKQNNSWFYSGRDSLDQIRLGVIQGYNYSQPVDSYIWQYHDTQDKVTHLSGNNALPRLLNMLEKDRIDVVIDDKFVLQHSINTLNMKKTMEFAGCLKDEGIKFYVAFSPRNSNSLFYARILSNAMAELRASGKLAEILAKYYVTDWR